jgi:hypothetical protein
MSPKASTTSEYFVSNEDILERVFKHKLAELFGSKAIYIEAPAGDVSHGTALTTPYLTYNRVGWFESTLKIQRYVDVKDRVVHCSAPLHIC